MDEVYHRLLTVSTRIRAFAFVMECLAGPPRNGTETRDSLFASLRLSHGTILTAARYNHAPKLSTKGQAVRGPETTVQVRPLIRPVDEPGVV